MPQMWPIRLIETKDMGNQWGVDCLGKVNILFSAEPKTKKGLEVFVLGIQLVIPGYSFIIIHKCVELPEFHSIPTVIGISEKSN